MSNPLPLRSAVPSAKLSPDRQLGSWKEIATHLGRTIRTVQRWEQAEGLPVHRHEHHKRSSVYAYTTELDRWWQDYKDRLGDKENRPLKQGVWGKILRPFRGASTRALVAGFVLLVAVLLAAGFYYFKTERRAALPLVSGDWVLVTDFTNQTGEPVFEESLDAAFAVALQQSAYVNLLPPSRVEKTLKLMLKAPDTKIDEALGCEICLRQNARGLITGNITKVGSRYSLSVRLLNPETGVVVRAYSERTSDQNGVLDTLGRIAASIRRDLGESLGSIQKRNQPLPAVTTPSLQALQLYEEGQNLWRKGSYQAAVKLYESALTFDSCFAMAHKALGAAFFSHIFSDPERGRAHYEKALQCADRISERERLMIQAACQRDLGHYVESTTLYKAYLTMFPDDVETRYGYGSLLMRYHRPEAAIEQLKEVVRLDPLHSSAYVNIATSYRELGRSDQALPFYEKAFEAEPGILNTANVVHEYGFALVHTGNTERARATLAKAASNPALKAAMLRSLALVDMIEGKYGEAKPKLQESLLITKTENSAVRLARAHLFLAIVLGAQGNRAGELQELDMAARELNLKSPVWLQCRVGAYYARLGAVKRAERMASDLGSQVDLRNLRDASSLHLLEGEVASARRNFPRALELLSLSDQEASNPETLASLADVHRLAGNSAQAIAYYEKLIADASAALGWEVQQSWIEAHARLAGLYLSAKENAKAAAILDVLTRLWAHADKELPLNRGIVQLRGRLQSAGNSKPPERRPTPSRE